MGIPSGSTGSSTAIGGPTTGRPSPALTKKVLQPKFCPSPQPCTMSGLRLGFALVSVPYVALRFYVFHLVCVEACAMIHCYLLL